MTKDNLFRKSMNNKKKVLVPFIMETWKLSKAYKVLYIVMTTEMKWVNNIRVTDCLFGFDGFKGIESIRNVYYNSFSYIT